MRWPRSAWNAEPAPTGTGGCCSARVHARGLRRPARLPRRASLPRARAGSLARTAHDRVNARRLHGILRARNHAPGTVFRVGEAALSSSRARVRPGPWRPHRLRARAPARGLRAAPAPARAVAAAAGHGEVVSRPLRTPRRFILVGLRWRGAAEPDVELRVRRGGRWSRWAHLEAHSEHNPDLWRGEKLVRGLRPGSG